MYDGAIGYPQFKRRSPQYPGIPTSQALFRRQAQLARRRGGGGAKKSAGKSEDGESKPGASDMLNTGMNLANSLFGGGGGKGGDGDEDGDSDSGNGAGADKKAKKGRKKANEDQEQQRKDKEWDQDVNQWRNNKVNRKMGM